MHKTAQQGQGATHHLVGFGLGLHFRVMRIKSDFCKLDLRAVQRDYLGC